MSEETLRVVSDLSPEDAITHWLAGIGIEAPIKTQAGERTVYLAEAVGMILLAAEISQRAREHLRETFGIEPNIEIAFDLNACRDRYAPRSTIIQGSLEFMRGTDGGLWFDDSRKLVLLKRGDDLRILDDDNLWTHTRLQLLKDQPYTREKLRAY